MPSMAERHVAQRQQQQQPRQRQPDTDREAEGDDPKEPNFERLKCLEFGLNHSPKDSCSAGIAISRNGSKKPAIPIGVSSAAANASRLNPAQRRASWARRSGASIASAARNAARASPNMKLPCRLAHNAITSSKRKGGPDPVSRATSSARDHSTRSGSASKWGRTSR